MNLLKAYRLCYTMRIMYSKSEETIYERCGRKG